MKKTVWFGKAGGALQGPETTPLPSITPCSSSWQEDYRKLLTKYAEAENTIDRLRLGAKVRVHIAEDSSLVGCVCVCV